MVLIEKPSGLSFSTSDAVMGLQFHGHTEMLYKYLKPQIGSIRVERLAAAAGTHIKIWALYWAIKKKNQNEAEIVQNVISDRTSFESYTQTNSSNDSIRKQKCIKVNINEKIQLLDLDMFYLENCHISNRIVCVLKDHAPHYVVNARFSSQGHILASCDSHTIIFFEFARFCEGSEINGILEEVWQASGKITDPHSDIFDLCWHEDIAVITGSICGIKVWNVKEKTLMEYIKYSDGFVTGVASFQNTYIAAESNDKRICVWKKKNNESQNDIDQSDTTQTLENFQKYFSIINDTGSLISGPFESPYCRRPSFDPTGSWVAFPYGERGNQCFGVAHSLKNPSCTPFRFRGHHLRVNCVAFCPVVFNKYIRNQTKSNQPIGTAKNFNNGHPNNTDTLEFTLYAQASVDGALSFWRVNYVSNDKLTASCIFILKPRFIDEQASVTDLAWTGDGTTLSIGADDGTITLVQFSLQEIEGEIQFKQGLLETVFPLTFQKIPPLPHLSRYTPKGPHNNPSVLSIELNKDSKASNVLDTTISPTKKTRRRVSPTLIQSKPIDLKIS